MPFLSGERYTKLFLSVERFEESFGTERNGTERNGLRNGLENGLQNRLQNSLLVCTVGNM